MSDYNKAIELNPDNADAYYDRGLTYYQQGGFIQAIPDYNKAIQIKPDYAGAFYNRALTYYQLKEYDNA